LGRWGVKSDAFRSANRTTFWKSLSPTPLLGEGLLYWDFWDYFAFVSKDLGI